MTITTTTTKLLRAAGLSAVAGSPTTCGRWRFAGGPCR
jgi:hypothetical protein